MKKNLLPKNKEKKSNNDEIIINIAKDFSETPGPRLKETGNFSGEEFFFKILEPNYKKAKEKDLKLIIELDGGYGYSCGFLEQSFGDLARKYGKDVLDRIKIISLEEPYLIEEINTYIKDAINNSKS